MYLHLVHSCSSCCGMRFIPPALKQWLLEKWGRLDHNCVVSCGLLKPVVKKQPKSNSVFAPQPVSGICCPPQAWSGFVVVAKLNRCCAGCRPLACCEQEPKPLAFQIWKLRPPGLSRGWLCVTCQWLCCSPQTFIARFRRIMDSSQNAYNEDTSALVARLDEMERALFQVGQKGLNDFQCWEKGQASQITASSLVQNYGKRKLAEVDG